MASPECANIPHNFVEIPVNRIRTTCVLLYALGLYALGVSASSIYADTPAPGITAERKALVTEPIQPTRIVKRPDGVFFIDFGRDAFAQLHLNIPIPADAANKITVRLGEKISEPDHIDPKPGVSIRYLQTTLIADSGKSDFIAKLTNNDARRMPPDIARGGGVMPFRYVELENLPDSITEGALKSGALEQVTVHYPFDDSAADFSSSDEKLNAFYDLCKYTMKATSFCGVFVDGDRERKPYEADAFINQLGWYYATDDTSLPRYTHEYLITHPTWPTEWIMFSVLTGWNDYLFTGDTTSLKIHYADLKAKTLLALERDDGLITTVQPPVPNAVKSSVHFPTRENLRDIVDWPAAERDGYQMAPVNTVVNAFHCRSLQLMAVMAAALGKSDDAADFSKAAEKTLHTLNTKLVDPNTGLYIDGEGSTHSSLHANMFPLAFGLVPEERREKVAAFVKSKGMACSVYGAQFLLDALCDNNAGSDAVNLIEAPGDRSWRHMVEDVGTTITLEAWDNKYKPNQDWNHAWGAAPANIIPAKILGIEPLAPGYAKALIWPRAIFASQLTWAKGKIPTVKGSISVEWRRSADRFTMNLELPQGVTADVRVPTDWGDQIQLDGKAAQSAKNEGGLALDISTSGKHTITVGK